MHRRPLFKKLLLTILLVALATQALLALFVGLRRNSAASEERQRWLSLAAMFAAARVEPFLPGAEDDTLADACRAIDEATGARVTVILPDGRVIADSRRDPDYLTSHADRPEVVDALAGREGYSRRFSASTQTRSLYAARAILRDDTPVAVVRVAIRDPGLLAHASSILPWLGVTALLAALAAFAARMMSTRVALTLRQMQDSARALAEGREAAAWPAPTTLELAELSDTFRETAATLREKIATIEHLLDEQRAVFESMVDGLLIIDSDERIVDLNRASAAMLGIDATAAKGRDIIEVARNANLATLVRASLASAKLIEGDVLIPGPPERSLQVHGTSFRLRSRATGSLMVLTDVTRLRKLEKVRRDFVANASHELKTPVTAIRAAAETLAAGDLDPGSTQRFSGIVARQADQLSALVEDLLELTRLEHDDERGAIEREDHDIREIVDAAVELCGAEANQKGTALTARCPDGIVARVNAPLLQRALVNLIDNAIKYSPPNTEVTVTAMNTDEGLMLTVRDQGPGIPAEHLDRIFERFYRIDKSRSRKLGGTGLGLSIVKHVAKVHEGEVRVSSVPGHGSAFTLQIPGSSFVAGRDA